jgi:hypothetical protein
MPSSRSAGQGIHDKEHRRAPIADDIAARRGRGHQDDAGEKTTCNAHMRHHPIHPLMMCGVMKIRSSVFVSLTASRLNTISTAARD